MILELFILMNLVRQTPLMYDVDLSYRATVRAEQLYKNNQWSHDNWKESFEGTGCSYIGENIAKDFPNAVSAHFALMQSNKHRDNIVSDKYNRVGIGEYENIVVQLFCNK
jgi:uncharacterized protein YkwD